MNDSRDFKDAESLRSGQSHVTSQPAFFPPFAKSFRRSIDNQDTIDELTARIYELQNEVNCMNLSRDSKDAESVRGGLSHVPSQPSFFHLIVLQEDC